MTHDPTHDSTPDLNLTPEPELEAIAAALGRDAAALAGEPDAGFERRLAARTTPLLLAPTADAIDTRDTGDTLPFERVAVTTPSASRMSLRGTMAAGLALMGALGAAMLASRMSPQPRPAALASASAAAEEDLDSLLLVASMLDERTKVPSGSLSGELDTLQTKIRSPWGSNDELYQEGAM